MAVAEIFLGAFITVLIEKLTSSDMINLLRSAGIHSELLKWNNILVQIQAVLVDAGQKHIRETSVEVWLRNLQQLAYDIDNILDDLAYEVLRRQLKKESDHASTSTSTSSNRVWKIIPTCCTTFTPRKLVYGHNMGSKLDEITTRLLELVDQKKILGLTDKVERSIGTSRQVEQTSLVDESKFVGREGDKEELLRLLKEPCDGNVSVVSIVGMGGMGKTTLANLLYKEVKDQFELSAWVCVSDAFNIFNISKAIFKDVGGEEKNFENLNQLHQALTEKLSQKRFLVVLDDVWNESYEKWEVFQRPFGVGAPGSAIIVTTRNTMVASVMDCVRPYHLKALSSEEALSLFAQHALGEPNFDSHQRLRVHGEGIIKKCDGLPLALRTLGRMLRRKTDVKEWEELLKSEIWSLQDNIIPALRLSYYDLPPHLKQIFAYCSLFPKDYVFDKDELVLLWMAEGFLNPKNGKKSMEGLGQEYFEELKSRSFFQHSTNDKSQYTMHDLINDLATSVAGEFFFRANDGMGNEALEKFHHLSFIRTEHGVHRKLKALHRASRLRTLLALPVSANRHSIFCFNNSKVIVELLPHLQFLRVLSLTSSSIEEVPQSIGSLKHIRYLNFSKTSISCLPEQVSDLYNLQSLLVQDCCKLSSLPHSFEKLINLRHLDIRGTPSLKKLPLGIGGLTSLQTLSKVIIDEDDGFKLSELKGLSDLHGRLSIMGLQKVKNATHAQEAKLHKKEGLDELEMEWSDASYGSQNEIIAYKVLEGLRPHDKLRKLKILFYNGTRFPYWVGDPSFDQLTELTLHACRSCTHLPTLGNLGSLRRLSVAHMNEMKTVDSEFLGRAKYSCQGIAFPSLEVLEFEDMWDWEIWTTNGCDNNATVGSFPRLQKISIISCLKLAEVSIGLIPSLEVLCVEGCTELVLRNMVGVSSSIRRLEIRRIEGLTHLHGEVIKHLGAVEHLCIQHCNEVRYLWESESEACKILVNLRELNIISCGKLLAVGGKEVNSGICLKSVRTVFVNDCKSLESYNCPNGIGKLTIGFCSSLTSLTFELPSTLKSLHLSACYDLEESCFHNNLLSSLESLVIYGWSNLRCIREGCFAHLTNLTIVGCADIESFPENGFGFLPHLCLRHLCIGGCANLKSFPHQHLQRLTSLKDMHIVDCPSMNDSFPCGSWPPNLGTLSIGNLKKPMSEWGSQNFPTSLATLLLFGKNSGVVSFAKEDVMNNNNTTSSCFLLPPSLTDLTIRDFRDLESLSEGLQHLTCLEALKIGSCPKLKDLPETLIPSLSYLQVWSCPELQKRCRYRKGDYWPIISEIHSFLIQG